MPPQLFVCVMKLSNFGSSHLRRVELWFNAEETCLQSNKIAFHSYMSEIRVRLPKVKSQSSRKKATQIDDYDVHKAAIWNIINAVEENVREKYHRIALRELLSHDVIWNGNTKLQKIQKNSNFLTLCGACCCLTLPISIHFAFCHYSNCFLLFTILCYRFESFSDSCCCCFCRRLSHSFTPLHVNFQCLPAFTLHSKYIWFSGYSWCPY